MTQLETNLVEIKRQKDTYLLPENIRENVTLLGVTGTLEEAKEEQTKTATPSTVQQIITPDEGKTLSSVTVSAVTAGIDTNIVASNIRLGVTILGVTGNVAPDKPDQDKTCTPTTSEQVITADTGYELASVTVSGVTSDIDSNIVASNIKSGVTILGVTGTLTAGIEFGPSLPETASDGDKFAVINDDWTEFDGIFEYDGSAWNKIAFTNDVSGDDYDDAVDTSIEILGEEE